MHCRFHGKDPSKNKKQKRIQKYEEDQKVKRAAASVQPVSTSERLQNAHHVSAQGAAGRGGASEAAFAPTPVLGGGDTPLMGQKKVAAMLGLKAKGDASMPSPPLRKK